MEEEDLIDYYNQHQGSMVELIESIPLSRNEDISRFISYFEKQIESKTIPHFKAFDKTKNKVRLLKNE
jgi:DnaJ family protein C protein 9